jgi:hypothetical protein
MACGSVFSRAGSRLIATFENAAWELNIQN